MEPDDLAGRAPSSTKNLNGKSELKLRKAASSGLLSNPKLANQGSADGVLTEYVSIDFGAETEDYHENEIPGPRDNRSETLAAMQNLQKTIKRLDTSTTLMLDSGIHGNALQRGKSPRKSKQNPDVPWSGAGISNSLGKSKENIFATKEPSIQAGKKIEPFRNLEDHDALQHADDDEFLDVPSDKPIADKDDQKRAEHQKEIGGRPSEPNQQETGEPSRRNSPTARSSNRTARSSGRTEGGSVAPPVGFYNMDSVDYVDPDVIGLKEKDQRTLSDNTESVIVSDPGTTVQLHLEDVRGHLPRFRR